jgi:hypothetical protein
MTSESANQLPGARALLSGPIDSFEKLEIALALASAPNPAAALDGLKAHSGDERSLVQALDELVEAGVVAYGEQGYRIAEGAGAGVEELVAAWSSRRAEVVRILTSRALERLRAAAARGFADAFSLHRRGGGKGGDDGG